MPIEVKELVMRFNVGEQTSCKPDKNDNQARASGAADDMERIVATCVEQVLDILERAQER
ncbi:MAG: hypothetical protein K0S11_301 [Gammaproteobacteria bacterium]|jgi:hypothetical protein|nr:hypothetical protein [Gammaproteobacteria bacterium]